MATESFEDFLKNKKKEDNPVNWEARRSIWVQSVDDLYSNVKNWLDPFIVQSLLRTDEKEVSLREDYIGSYEMKQLNILLGNDMISLVPRGTLILGSYGRIDMRGPKGERLLIEKNWNEWQFVTKVNKRELWEVNEDSFKSAIQDLING